MQKFIFVLAILLFCALSLIQSQVGFNGSKGFNEKYLVESTRDNSNNLSLGQYSIASSDYYLICTGKHSKSYHKDFSSPSSYCRGLRACKSDVIRLPSSEAKRLRSDPCDFCFGH